MVSYSDYARKLDGLDLCGLGQKPHRLGSHRYHRFPQIFLSMRSDKGHADFAEDADFDLSGLGISQISGISLMTYRILALFLVVSKKMRNFASAVKRLNYRRIDYGCLCCKPTL